MVEMAVEVLVLSLPSHAAVQREREVGLVASLPGDAVPTAAVDRREVVHDVGASAEGLLIWRFLELEEGRVLGLAVHVLVDRERDDVCEVAVAEGHLTF